MEGVKRGLSLISPIFTEGMDCLKEFLVRSTLRIALAYLSILLPIVVGLIYLFLSGAGLLSEELKPIFAFVVVALFAFALLAEMVLLISAVLGHIQNIYHKRKTPFFSRENLFKSLKLFLFSLFILALASIPIILAQVFLGQNAAVMAAMIEALVLGLLSIPAFILLYYTLQEIAIPGKGIIDSMKGSIRLVRGNFWETLTVGLALFAVSMVIYFVCIFALYVFIFAVTIISALLSAALGADLSFLSTILFSLGYFLYLALTALAVSANIAFYSTMHTLLYKRLQKK